jgi:myo-inositol-1(or 4)-monophosphatase
MAINTNLTDIRHIAETIAREAGDIVMNYYGTGFKQATKATQIDIVTEADEASEKHIVHRLTTTYPDHHIVGEEGGGMGAPRAEAAYRWYVDPVDGTTNFANGIPVFAISLALTDADMNPLVGVVYNPAQDELFSAAKAHGATRNGERIYVSDKAVLQQCVLASGFPYDKYTDSENNLDRWGKFLVRTRGLRRMGAAALDCCYVAAGRFDGYWEAKVHPWDVLAGILCVTEAGGTISNYHGETPPGFVTEGRVVVSNGHIHQQMLDVLAGTL